MRRVLLLACLTLLAPAGAEARPRIAEFAMDVRTDVMASTAALGARVRTAVLVPGRRFDLLGLRWRGGGELKGARVRTRTQGRWSPWTAVASADDHGTDRPRPTQGSDPVWVDGADALQLSWRAAPDGMRLRFVRVTDRVRVQPRASGAQAGAPAMVTRAQWDPANQCAPRERPEMGRVQMALVHHTASTNEYAPDASPAIVLAICRYHRNANGWSDIGYNFLVDRYGRLFEGRAGGIDQPVVGAQAQGWNSQSTSISSIGTYQDVAQPGPATQSMARLLAWKLGVHGVPVTGRVTLTSAGGGQNRYPAGQQVTFERIAGHRDGGLTLCPGQKLYEQLPELRQVAARSPGAVTTPPGGTVTLAAVAGELVYPEPARLTGSVAGGGQVWVQVAAGRAYRTVARVDAAPDGTWSAEVPLTRSYVFRALQVLPDGSRGAASPLLSVGLRPLLAARAPRRVLTGTSATVRGTIGPPQVRVTATTWFQGRSGRWIHVRKVASGARDGRFALRVPFRRPGVYRVRVAFAGTRFAQPAAAPDLFLRVVRTRRGLSGGAAAPAG